MSAQARITVRRQSPTDLAQREIFVTVDGEELAILQLGDEATREIAPGRHRIRLHNTFVWKNIDVDLQPGEHAVFSAINRAGWGTYSAAWLLGACPVYLTVERQHAEEAAPAPAGPPG